MTTIKQLNLVESQAMTASFNSSEADVSQFVGFSIQCVYTGSPNGSPLFFQQPIGEMIFDLKQNPEWVEKISKRKESLNIQVLMNA